MSTAKELVAYFSMEIALSSELPTYAGGLGVLAGDTLRAAADLDVAMVGITLLHRRGYFRQVLDAQGHQQERDVVWSPAGELIVARGSEILALDPDSGAKYMAVEAWERQLEFAKPSEDDISLVWFRWRRAGEKALDRAG